MLIPSSVHTAQRQQTLTYQKTNKPNSGNDNPYTEGMKVYVWVYTKNKSNNRPYWTQAVVVKILEARNCNVRVNSTGQIWRRHVDQLRRQREGNSESIKSTHLDKEINTATTISTRRI